MRRMFRNNLIGLAGVDASAFGSPLGRLWDGLSASLGTVFHRAIKALVPVLAILLIRASVFAQEEWQVACSTCRVSLERVAVLGDEEGEGYVGEVSTVRRGQRFFYLWHWEDQSRVKVYDSDGRFLQTLGQRGGGPGEFEGIIAMEVSPGDSLFVLDAALMRYTVFSPELALVRTADVPFLPEENSIAFLPGGSFLASGRVPTRDLVGLPHHLFDRSGERLVSFGDPLGRDVGRDQFFRFPTASRSGTFWVAHYEQYRLTEWGVAGEKLRTISPVREWFEQSKEDVLAPSQNGARPPQSAILDIVQDDEGLLWVLGRTQDPDWRQVARSDGRVDDRTAFFDSVLEVIDPDTGVILASHRIDETVFWGFADSTNVFGIRWDGAVPKIDIWRVELLRAAPASTDHLTTTKGR
jgi:hypothetical protein